ncbi:hypothetical protein PENANT_c012G07991 [Penicillium antarcticum]|uniref:Uncharacterized protein n=1 Tax=Penicillium antarcticum TaxID=416450 RepID=A0A1V6Q5Z7_9EURO|nr:uncharacterized protein N7508_008026 [Penicillium antarcticum]KAJ5297777.1 hypothetical protein N7508_008026 [Penicillium antarcticum]OQD84661.1 hypothetical protein PENANT_c012G07991 [Penicillium antarcticum]
MSSSNSNAGPITPSPTPTPNPDPSVHTGIPPRAPSARGSNREMGYVPPLRSLTSPLRSSRGSSADIPIEWHNEGFITEDYRVGGPYMCSLPIIIEKLTRRHKLYPQKEKDRVFTK